MTTVGTLVDRIERRLDRRVLSILPATFTEVEVFDAIKDCYDRITDECGIPTATAAPSYTGNGLLTLPTDIWDGVNGIISLDVDGTPIDRGFRVDLQSVYGTDWKTFSNGIQYYVEYDNDTKILLVSAGKPNQVMNLLYVKNVPAPTSRSDSLPPIFEMFANVIPYGVLGMCYDIDKEGRGAAYTQMFESFLLRRKRIRARQGKSRRRVRDGYTKALSIYRNQYGRR